MSLQGETIVCLTHDKIPAELKDIIHIVADTHGKRIKSLPVGSDGETVNWEDTALLLALGGDGTFLEGVRLAAPTETPLLAINVGTLGFLARIAPADLEDALADALSGSVETIDREMLSVTGAVTGDGINDVMVEPTPPESPVDRKIATVHVYIDDEYAGEFTGSGVAVSTPTGSTAVSFSAGGPVHYPNANSTLQVTPLHTHNAGVRPIIVDADTTVTLLPETDVEVSIDGGRTHATITAGEELYVSGADQKARIVRTEYDETFFDAMAGKLGWGIRDVDDPGPLGSDMGSL